MTKISDTTGPNGWADHMRSLLGKQVKITINKDPEVTVVGQLLSFEDGGETITLDDMGFRHYSWPCLEAEEIKNAT